MIFDNRRQAPPRRGRRDPRYGSRLWKSRRREVLIRDQHRCQIRLSGCTGFATQCDHMVSPNPFLGGGSFFDMSNLRASCSACNNRAMTPRCSTRSARASAGTPMPSTTPGSPAACCRSRDPSRGSDDLSLRLRLLQPAVRRGPRLPGMARGLHSYPRLPPLLRRGDRRASQWVRRIGVDGRPGGGVATERRQDIAGEATPATSLSGKNVTLRKFLL
jgi:hypothetical protein